MENTFESNNFQYNLIGDNGGLNQGYLTVPWQNGVINNYILIPAKTTQNYTVTFKLVGVNEPQNYDQDKTFKGYIKIGT